MPATVAVERHEEIELSEVELESPHALEPQHDYAATRVHAAHEAPGHERHAHFHGVAGAAPARRTRFAGALRHIAHGHVAHGGADTVTLPQDEDVLVFRRVMEEAAPPASFDEVVVEASRARRRARAPHRPFRLTAAQWLIVGTLFGQLTGVLWWQSQALALRNRDQKLRDEIARTGQQIAQTKHAISQLDSEANLTQLAAQMHWSPAPVNNFDNVTDRHRLTPQEVAALTATDPAAKAAAGEAAGEAATAPEPPLDNVAPGSPGAAPDSPGAMPDTASGTAPNAAPNAAPRAGNTAPAGEGH